MKTLLIAFLCLSIAGLRAENQFLAAGLPGIDKVWSGEDYVTASKILADGKVPLPTLAAEEGRRVIARLTDVSNLEPLRDKTLRVELRYEDWALVQSGSASIFETYLSARTDRSDKLDPETTRLWVFCLRVAAVGVELVNEILPNFPRDENYQARMDGVQQLKGGLMSAFGQAEAVLGNPPLESGENQRIMLKAMEEILPTIQGAFTPEYREYLQNKLKTRLDHLEGRDRDPVASMLRTLHAEQDSTDQPATAPESKPEGNEGPEPESLPAPR